MPRIFICYRRDDSQHQAGRLFGELVGRFGEDHIFKDVNSIEYGKDFRSVVNESILKTDVFLVLIGDGWLTAELPGGARRLEDGDDDVRIEIESALEQRERRGMKVIPVLVGKAGMPRPSELPKSLSRLTYCHALPVRPDPDFETDMARLIRAIDRSKYRWVVSALVFAGLLAVWAGLGWFVFQQVGRRSPPRLPAQFVAEQLERLFDANQLDEAAAICDRKIAEGRDLADAYAGRGRVHHIRGLRTGNRAEFRQALDDYTYALGLHPSDALVYARRASCHAAVEDHAAAAADVQAALAHDAGSDSWLYYNLARVAEAEKNDMQAIEYLGRAIDINRKKLEAATGASKDVLRERCGLQFSERARLFIKRSYLTEALNDLDDSLRLFPNPDAYAYRGLVHLDRAETEKAQADLKEAFRLAPKSALALYGLAISRRNRYVTGATAPDEEAELASAVRDVVEAIYLTCLNGDGDGYHADEYRRGTVVNARWRRYLVGTAAALLNRAREAIERQQAPARLLAEEAHRILGPVLTDRPWDLPVRRIRWQAAVLIGSSHEREGAPALARKVYQAASDDGAAEATLALAKLAEADRGGDWEVDRAQQLRELARDQEVVEVRFKCKKRDGQGESWESALVTTPKAGSKVASDEAKRLLVDRDAIVSEELLEFLDETLKEARRLKVPFPAHYREQLDKWKK